MKTSDTPNQSHSPGISRRKFIATSGAVAAAFTIVPRHVLGGAGTFHTRSGPLVCSRADDGWIEMDFPADPTIPEPAPPSLAATLGLDPGTDAAPTVRAFARARADLVVEGGREGAADSVTLPRLQTG